MVLTSNQEDAYKEPEYLILKLLLNAQLQQPCYRHYQLHDYCYKFLFKNTNGKDLLITKE